MELLFYSTNSLFINSNILKLRDLIIYKNIFFMHTIFVGNCTITMNNIFCKRFNKYRYSTFNYALPYINIHDIIIQYYFLVQKKYFPLQY